MFNLPELGEIDIVDCYLYYDGECLFLAKDSTNKYYIGVCVEDIPSKKISKYLLCSIDESKVKSNSFNIQKDVDKKPGYLITCSWTGEPNSFELIGFDVILKNNWLSDMNINEDSEGKFKFYDTRKVQ
jgi:hypothetical protein